MHDIYMFVACSIVFLGVLYAIPLYFNLMLSKVPYDECMMNLMAFIGLVVVVGLSWGIVLPCVVIAIIYFLVTNKNKPSS